MQPGKGKKLMILDRPNLYQCLCIYGDGPDDLQLYLFRKDHEDQSLAIWLVFCTAGSPVRPLHRAFESWAIMADHSIAR